MVAQTELDWRDPAKIEMLKKLWAEGLSLSEIGARMKLSRSAISGKVHRLGLPGRSSPIKRDGVRTIRVRSRQQRSRHEATKIAAAVIGVSCKTSETGCVMGKRDFVPSPPVAMVVPPVAKVSKHPCQFPFGDPRQPGFRFCEKPAVVGRPYCERCMQVAYVRAAA